MIAVLDANILISFLDGSHTHHLIAVDLVAKLPGDLVIHDLTLSEVLVGAYRQGTTAATLHAIRDTIGIEPWSETGPDWAAFLAEIRATAQPRITMPDAIVLATALRLNGKVVTFDQKLQEAARVKNALYVTTS